MTKIPNHFNFQLFILYCTKFVYLFVYVYLYSQDSQTFESFSVHFGAQNVQKFVSTKIRISYFRFCKRCLTCVFDLWPRVKEVLPFPHIWQSCLRALFRVPYAPEGHLDLFSDWVLFPAELTITLG